MHSRTRSGSESCSCVLLESSDGPDGFSCVYVRQGALEHYTARQIRMLFLLHRYNDTLEYGPAAMDTVTRPTSQLATDP